MPKIPLVLRSKVPLLLGLLTAAVAAGSWWMSGPRKGARPRVALTSPTCGATSPTSAAALANPEARAAAQRGLGFLTKASQEWTAQHRCFGCHVQAVTLEALTVGSHHQYQVAAAELDSMVSALELGVTAGGRVTGAAFQGQAWARYDAWIDDKHTNDLLKYAAELVGLQREDGSIPDDDARLPITGGTMQTTYQSMQTWRQAYARTADDKWLAPMRKAERYLATRAAQWPAGGQVYLQDLNFALLGLLAAGVGPGEPAAQELQRRLLDRQREDGGWTLESESDALATGQTLYALRLAGHGDGEAAIDRGTAWLIKHQGKDGAWRSLATGQGGAEKGEAMWAVLGLVSMDVTSVAVNGLIDGQHVTPSMQIGVAARDNQAGGVTKVELYVDDDLVAAACADELLHTWDTRALTEGKHTLDVVATNLKQQTSRRRYQVYAGNTYLTELGARFDEAKQATEIAARNLAVDAKTASQVELTVFAVTGDANQRGAKVFTAEQPSAAGALSFTWDGVGADGKPQPSGRYIAELALRAPDGKVLQRTETLFLQASEAVQRATYGEIEGQLGLDGDAAASTAANTVIELVNQAGDVVQRVRSTEQGNYRFKNVTGGKYRVRAAKAGWAKQELEVDAAPASAPTKANMQIKRR
ncbi:MAG: carboxypeptidase regulatory-like domain-containing protein [Kofleriaceae bacterium]